MQKFKNALVLGISVVALSLSGLFAGCNTVEGVGEDIEEGGEAVQDVAE